MQSFEGVTGQDGTKTKIKSRVSEQVACFESCLAWDHHYLPSCMSVAVIKLPSQKRLHSNYRSLSTSRATKDPLLPSASLQAHKRAKQVPFAVQLLPKPEWVTAWGLIVNRQGCTELQDDAQVCLLAHPNLQMSKEHLVLLFKQGLCPYRIMNSKIGLFFVNICAL